LTLLGRIAWAAPDVDPGVAHHLEEGRPRRPRPFARRERVTQYGFAAAFLVAAVAMALSSPVSEGWSWPTAALLVASFAIASRIEFQEVGVCYTVPTQLVFVPMLLLVPAGAVPALVAAGFLLGKLPDYLNGRTHPERAVLALGDAWFAVGPALVILATHPGTPTWDDWPVYLAALAAQFAGDFVVSVLREWLARGASPASQLSEIGWVYTIDAVLSPIGLVAAFASVQHPYAFLLVVPLLGLLALFAAEREVRIRQALALSHAYRGTAMLLGDLVEDDDSYTGHHSRGVVVLALRVADRMSLDPRQRRDLEFAALLHDVGKVAIPKEVINKAGPLTQEEMALVRTHTIEGHRILTRFGGVLGDVGRIVRACHERWDGCGYPDGLAGKRIPLAARVIFACDAFNAMTTDRTYRLAMTQERALEELRANAGSQFDPAVVEIVCDLLRPAGDATARAEAVVERSGSLARDQALA
jgi:HD-GYP domain-containing protein (c-di-GMP phosphodiesterase class II)